MLLLIALQKLAASSIAAIRNALSKRRTMLTDTVARERTTATISPGDWSESSDELSEFEEAAQHRCATLVHIDLPWNPMRMHQRVGRLNRYGQTRPVSVYLLRNPDPVEARIGHVLMDKLLDYASTQQVFTAFLSGLEAPTLLVRVEDEITGTRATVHRVIIGY